MLVGHEFKIPEFPAPDVSVVIKNIIFRGSEVKVGFMVKNVMLAEKDVFGVRIFKSSVDLQEVCRVASLSVGNYNIFAETNRF